MAIEWVPYELHPEVPAEGVDRDQVLPPAYRARAEEGVRRLAGQVGLTMTTHSRLINSRPALQAAEFARAQGRFDAMHEALFKAYWEEGQDVSDLNVLREVATGCGLDAEAMKAAIRVDRYGDYLDARRQEAEDLMITGIPAHVIADRYLVMGAQPYETFQRVMDRLDVPRKAAPSG